MKKVLKKYLVAFVLLVSTIVSTGCCWGSNYEVKIPDELK